MRQLFVTLVVMVILASSLGSADAAKVGFGDEGELEIYGYLQPRFDLNLDVGDTKTPFASTEPGEKFDFSIRRARLVLEGHMTPQWHFFFGAITVWYGRGGDFGADIAVSDMWLQYRLARYFKVQAGLMKGSFGRDSFVGGAKNHGIDWRAFMLKRVAGDPNGRTPPFRDMGLRVSGIVDLPVGSVDYRLSILDGKEPGGGADNPRFAGRVAYNVFDAEPEYLIANSYFGRRKILTFGISYDVQAHVAVPGGESISSARIYETKKETYYAIALDAHADIPLGYSQGIVGSLAVHYWGNSIAVEKATAGGSAQLPQGKGWGMAGEVGYRFKKYEPLLAVEYFKPTDAATAKRMTLIGGLNYWLKGHSLNLKAQFAMSRIWVGDTAANWGKVFTLQSQVLFR